MVVPVSSVAQFHNGNGYQRRDGWEDLVTLDSVAPGTVCMLPGGVIPLILKTRYKFKKRLQNTPDSWIVASLTCPSAQQGDIEVDDMGPAGDYNGLKFFMPEKVI